MKYFESEVIGNEQITEDIFVLCVARKDAEVHAGRFFMIKCWDSELTLMRPISLFRSDDRHLWFMYRIVGKGTRRLSELQEGDSLELMGPCGNGFPCEALSGRIAVVGGGVGIPPLCETAKTLKQCGVDVDAYLGFKDELFAVEEFEPWCQDIFVTTEKGEEGYRGFVTDLLHPEQYDASGRNRV